MLGLGILIFLGGLKEGILCLLVDSRLARLFLLHQELLVGVGEIDLGSLLLHPQ